MNAGEQTSSIFTTHQNLVTNQENSSSIILDKLGHEGDELGPEESEFDSFSFLIFAGSSPSPSISRTWLAEASLAINHLEGVGVESLF